MDILSISNAAYLRHVRALAVSLAENAPQVRLILHLVNVPGDAAEAVSRIHPCTVVQTETRRFDTPDVERSYCCNARVGVLRDLLTRSRGGMVLYLDADSIVRSDISGIEMLLRGHDLLILHRGDQQEAHLRYATGVIGVRDTPATREFLSCWKADLDGRRSEWFADQLSFAAAAATVGSRISIGALPNRYIDWEFHRDSPIWVGKGPRKFENRRYRLEEEYFFCRTDDAGPWSAARWYRRWLGLRRRLAT
jgi:hypothetical protein